jgi:hypothetical protein
MEFRFLRISSQPWAQALWPRTKVPAHRQIRSTSDAHRPVICASRPVIADESPTVQAARRVPGSSGRGTLVTCCQVMLIRVPAGRPGRLFTIFLADNRRGPMLAG